MLDLTITSKLIKDGREKAGLSQEKLAEMLHVSKQAVSNWERGKNLPDEGCREDIEGILDIKLHNERMAKKVCTPFIRQIPEIKPLEEINSLEELLPSIERIIDSVAVDAYESTVKEMLYLTLTEMLGYGVYYQLHCHKIYSDEDPMDWGTIAAELGDFIKVYDKWPLERTTYPFRSESLLAKKVEWIAYMIGGELFEDFDEDGYRDDYPQQIGRLGEECGYDLLNLIPDSNTDLMVIYRSAILDVAEMLRSTIGLALRE